MSAAPAVTAVPTLAVRGATKRFGAVVGLDGVDLEIHRGQVLALLGDNGAGKSTLIKCLSGAIRLDSGEIEMDGAVVSIRTPGEARELGIETVYQDLALFDNLRPSDNFYAGRELAGPSWLPRSGSSDGARWVKRPKQPFDAYKSISTSTELSGSCPADNARRLRSAGRPPSHRRSSCSTSRRRPSACASRGAYST